MLFNLPQEILLAIASAILGPPDNPQSPPPDRAQLLAVARLAWSCRAAYFAYRPLLWRRLTLALHRDHQCQDFNPAALVFSQHWALDERLRKHLALQHQQVLNSSLFPTIRAGLPQPGSRWGLLLSRIKEIAGHFGLLAPYVVHEGRLHLASLHEEQIVAARSITGIRSLWGPNAGVQVTVRNGLVLVPFPMHLVQAITVCELDPSLFLTSADFLRIVQQVPSLFRAPANQVKSLDLLHLSSSEDGSFLLHHALTDRYSQATSLKYALARCAQSAPLPLVAHADASALRSLSLFFTGDMTLASWLKYVASWHNAPNLTRLELLGQAPADLDAALLESTLFRGQSSIFHLHRLTHLALVFSVTENDPKSLLADQPKQAARPVSLAHLHHLRLSTPIARILFDPKSAFRSPFLSQGPSFRAHPPAVPMFPQLTKLELTLMMIDRCYGLSAEQRSVPVVSFVEMPNLSAFRILDDGNLPSDTFMVPFDYFATLAVSAPSLEHLSIETFNIEYDDQQDDASSHEPTEIAWPSLKHVDLPWQLASVFAHTVSTNDVTGATFRFNLDLELAWYDWWSEWPNLQQLTLTHANDAPPAHRRRMAHGHLDSHGSTAGGVIGARGLPEAETEIAEHVVYPSLRSLTVIVAGQDAPLSFSGFMFPNLERLTLDMQHPLLDGFTDAPLRYLTIRGSHTCPRFVSQLLWMAPLDPNLRVRFIAPASSPTVPACSVPTGCLPNPLRLRFDPPIDGRKWEALMHAAPFADWGAEEQAVSIGVADALTDREVDLIVDVLERLLCNQARPVRLEAVLDPAAIADLLTEDELGVFERLCGRLDRIAR